MKWRTLCRRCLQISPFCSAMVRVGLMGTWWCTLGRMTSPYWGKLSLGMGRTGLRLIRGTVVWSEGPQMVSFHLGWQPPRTASASSPQTCAGSWWCHPLIINIQLFIPDLWSSPVLANTWCTASLLRNLNWRLTTLRIAQYARKTLATVTTSPLVFR